MFKRVLLLLLVVLTLPTVACSFTAKAEEVESTTLRSMAEKEPVTNVEDITAKTVYSTTIPLETVDYNAPFDGNQGGGVPPHVLVDESHAVWQPLDADGRWPLNVEFENADGGIILENETLVPYIPDNRIDGEALTVTSGSKPKVELFIGDDGIGYDIWEEMDKCAGLLTFYKDGEWTGPVCN